MSGDDIFYVYFLRRSDKTDPIYPYLNQPLYVGKGSDWRTEAHRREAKSDKLSSECSNPIKIRIIRKLWENGLDFTEEIMFDRLLESEAFEIEKEMIALYGRKDLNTGCLANLTNGGEGMSGWIPTEEWLQNLSERQIGEKHWNWGRTVPEEVRQKIRDSLMGENSPLWGTHPSEEARQKMRDNHADFSGENSPMWGKPGTFLNCKHTEETKKKIGKGRTGKKHTEEAKKKISESKIGKPSSNKGKPMSEERKKEMSRQRKDKPGHPHTEESKRKISESNKGRTMSKELKLKMNRTGKPHSEETKLKMKESRKKYLRNKNWDDAIHQYLELILK